MQLIGYGKEYWRQLKPRHSGLQESERKRCLAAIEKFRANPKSPGLNFERLGGGARKNHCSIRASRELRVILAVNPPVEPAEFAPVNMGHHDPMYAWSEQQGFHTNLKNAAAVYRPQDAPDAANLAAHPRDFEEWMLFLPQEQRRLTTRNHSGAFRIRGAAGTGKTVIALHRAAALGRLYPQERILFTTYSRSLCTQMQALFQRLPNAPRNVDFLNIDRIAWETLKNAERSTGKIDGNSAKKAAEAFDAAYRNIVPDTPLERFDRDYLKEEIERVIKGRAAAKEEYLDTGRFERRGRMQSFKKRDREICWRLCERWDKEMHARGAVSFPDLLIQARDLVQQRQKGSWRAAIVDEAQDMTLVGMQLVCALVAGAPENNLPVNGIMMLDDAAQRIYAGGFKPSWAGLDFTGRSEILRKNYRNGRAIFEAARAVRGDTLVVKEDNDDGAAALDVKFARGKGARPIFWQVKTRGEAPAVADKVCRLVAEEGFALQEIGVLAHRGKDADRLVRYLNNRLKETLHKAPPCVNLKSLREKTLDPGLRVGTFDRAKGLEFRAVLIPRLGQSRFPRDAAEQGKAANAPPPELLDQEKEARLLQLTRLYVAMTRARDRLYLIADEEPCSEIAAAYGCFERRSAKPTDSG